jgi:hypothetical protein
VVGVGVGVRVSVGVGEPTVQSLTVVVIIVVPFVGTRVGSSAQGFDIPSKSTVDPIGMLNTIAAPPQSV